MARYLVATHHATVERDWLCGHCNAFGTVTVRAVGQGEKRVWFSRDSAADTAHERAAVSLERDADRIVSLVRCPKCRERARGAALGTLWHGLGDLGMALAAAALVGVASWAYFDSVAIAFGLAALGALVMLVIGDERRRWSEARRARPQIVRSAQPRAPSAPVTRPSAPPASSPFRSPPAPAPIAVVQPVLEQRVPTVVKDESAPPPTFLV